MKSGSLFHPVCLWPYRHFACFHGKIFSTAFRGRRRDPQRRIKTVEIIICRVFTGKVNRLSSCLFPESTEKQKIHNRSATFTSSSKCRLFLNSHHVNRSMTVKLNEPPAAFG